MTLRLKFLVLISLVTLSVLVSAVTAIWAASLQRAAAENVLNLPVILEELGRLRRSTDALHALLPSAPSDDTTSRESTHRDTQHVSAAIIEAHSALEGSPGFDSWAGVGASTSLRQAVRDCSSGVQSWMRSGELASAAELREHCESITGLVNYCERQVLSHAAAQIEDNQRLRQRTLQANYFAILGALLMSALAYILLHRWVISPVAALRTAAGHIAKGDYEHRIRVTGRDEFARLNAEVNHMAGMIVAMQRDRIEQERFAAIGQMVRRLAHNLRNPLAGIRGLAELTRNELEHESPLRENQQRIVTSVDKFEQWLAELLNATSPLQLRPGRIDPTAWLRGLVDAHRPMALTRGVNLEINLDDAPASVLCDERHLGHAIIAILSNGIEACPRDGSVHLKAEKGPETNQWTIRITDDGDGVPPELITRIFAAHFTTKSTGNGIGLAVAQQIVRAHNGRIHVDGGISSENGVASAHSGRGANFEVILPLDAGAPLPEENTRSEKLENL